MKLIKLLLSSSLLLSLMCAITQATELDDYLIQQKIISADYKIKNNKKLTEVLTYLSDEDSRTLPLQINQNTLIEKLRLYPNYIEIEGIITSPDFKQFAQSLNTQDIKKLFTDNLIKNCDQLFEHQFQRVNPHEVRVKLSTDEKQYSVELKNSQCQF
ncbi:MULTISPECIES: hypothetical protein [unclassified Acinetobacter]|uniref:hypothetical protein n=1 Tax=unclassified Acinetobacter TaxID=196816 RepID=UPI0025789703|nr:MULTISPECIES: hypothetical protein [unclassified Acinetobacter]MDM1765355.1 hypothetical protein [Acinetobacter sp. 226-1]MDM1768860.1 hypothetical protein [Acinetobacter sp. 226-4]